MYAGVIVYNLPLYSSNISDNPDSWLASTLAPFSDAISNIFPTKVFLSLFLEFPINDVLPGVIYNNGILDAIFSANSYPAISISSDKPELTLQSVVGKNW